MDTRTTKSHSGNRADSGPLATRRRLRELLKNRFVPHKKASAAPSEAAAADALVRNEDSNNSEVNQ